MTHQEKRVFFNWLQKHGALQYYKKNRYLYFKHPTRRLTIIPYIALNITNAISGAFIWVDTDQGDVYWEDLSRLWCGSKECNQFFPI